jgi:hypothetical protein
MQPERNARSEQLQESIESVRQAKRRQRALLRAPVTAPSGFSKKELRQQCLEAKEEFLSRR